MMRVSSVFVLTLLVSMVVGATQSRADDAVTLKPSLKVGDVCYIEVKEHAKQKVTGKQAPSGGVSLEHSYIFGYRQEVKAIEDGVFEIELTIERFAVDMPIPMMGRYKYDTDLGRSRDTSGLAMMLDPLLGMKFTMRVDSDLKVTAFDGLDAVIQKLQASGRHPLLMQVAGLLAKARQTCGDELFSLYANKDVKPGESWTRELDVGEPGQGVMHMAYQLKLASASDENDKSQALVEYDCSITMDAPVQQAGPFAGAKSELEDTATHGSYLFNKQTGRIDSLEQQGSLTLRMLRKPATEGGERVEVMRLEQTSEGSMRTLTLEEREKEKSSATSQPAQKAISPTSQPTTAPASPADTAARPTAPASQPAKPAA